MKWEIMEREYSYWNAVLSNVRDDPDMAYAASMDALIKWKSNGDALAILTRILEEHYVLSSKKLEGISFALLEYQLLEPISEDVVERLKKVVESRIFDDKEGEEKKWIENVLKLMTRQFSNYNFTWVISILNDPNRKIPSLYIEDLLGVLNEYVSEYRGNREFRGYLLQEISRIKNDLLRLKLGAKSEVGLTDNRELKLKLIGVLSSKDSWMKLNKASLAILRMRIREFILSVLFDNSTVYSFVGATSVIIGLGGYFINAKWGAIVCPGVYVLICLILIPRLRKKYQPK